MTLVHTSQRYTTLVRSTQVGLQRHLQDSVIRGAFPRTELNAFAIHSAPIPTNGCPNVNSTKFPPGSRTITK